MNKQIITVKSSSPEDTEKLAEKIGASLKGGEVIELVSDLGGGKTTFVRGLARGIKSKDRVSSPTFKISNEYQGSELRMYHFDFYRLGEAGIIADELAEVVGDLEGIVVVEWADIVQDVLPEEKLTIVIGSLAENERELQLECAETLNYLVEGIGE